MTPFDFADYHDLTDSLTLPLDTIRALLRSWQGDPGQDWQPLSGGFRNQHYALRLHGQTCVLRIGTDLESFRKEMALLRYFKARGLDPSILPVPEVFATLETILEEPGSPQRLGLALLSYCAGQRAEIALQTAPADPLAIGRLLGRGLRALQASLHFEGAGFIDDSLKLTAPYHAQTPHQGMAYREYMLGVLNQPQARQVCGEQRLQQLLLLLASQTQRFQQIEGQGLCHCDFNLKNILLKAADDGWQVSAVLDWEFASAGSGLGDIGNFYRFDHRLPPALFSGFEEGYGPISVEDLLQARLLDLASICNFIERPAGPRRQKLVHEIVDKTLALFTAN